MDSTLIVQALAMGLVVGFAVGCTGIGGIVLVPYLTYAAGLDVQHAIAATLISYLPSGVVAVFLYARRGSISWRMAWPLSAAALPSAFLGALVAARASAMLLEALIGGLMLTSGLYTLRPQRASGPEPRVLGGPGLAGLGSLSGFLSAMTGAGGALILVPLLLIFDQPVLLSIGLGQVIAIPIAIVASLANLSQGHVDVGIALVLASSLAAGIAIGTPLAHALPQALLRRLLAVLIAALGAGMLLRLAWRVFGSAI
ncbi:MAG: sulfite exporter TauE/SafE family protein [Proteobacteria bacterium]|nr:sulfite exporter TauE/SafE family protein [Pseudomonadota bacterium]MBI3507984.1 sulfite exporter TauE/SafE family protein [Pseudomonadota bacterium]